MQWQKTLGSNGNDYAFSIKQLLSGDYILTGYSEFNNGDVIGNHGNFDCWVVKLTNSGTINWQKSFGGSGVDMGYSVEEISAGSYIIAAYSGSNDGDVALNYANY